MVKLKFLKHQFDFKTETEMLMASRSYYAELKKRRTVRDFSDKAIPMEVIENAILSAGTAPSGANQQPWHFAVVTDQQMKIRIREAAEEEEREFYEHRASDEWLELLEHLGTDENKPFLEVAPCLIVVFQKKFTLDAEGKRKKNYYTPESVGIASGFLLSALHLSGLATLTHTPSPMRFFNKLLNRPSEERPVMVVVVGYPSTQATVPNIAKFTLSEIASFH
ncbi:MAG: iodotyrosine deiodinase [Saprospiraceae bacterium]|jgi:iodotyrosine deiodinase